MANRLAGLLEAPRQNVNRLAGLVEAPPIGPQRPPISLASPQAQIEAGVAVRPEIDPAILKEVQQMLARPEAPEPTQDFRIPINVSAKGPGLWQQTKNAWERSGQSIGIDFMYHKVAMGELDESVAIEADKEFQSRSQRDPIEGRNWAQDLFLKTVQVARPMAAGAVEGAAAGTAAGTAAAAAGQLGPQVAFPEEIVTVPGAFAAGQVVGSVNYWAQQGSGSIYRQARQQGVSPEAAKFAAAAGGPLYAFIEFSQVDKIIPGLGKLKGSLLTKAIQVGVNTAKEIGEEGIQKVITDGAVNMAKVVEGDIKAADVPAEAKQMALNALNEMKESAGPLAVLSLPSAVVGVGETIAERRPAVADVVEEEAPPTVPSQREVTAEKRKEAIDTVRGIIGQEQFKALSSEAKAEIGQRMLAEQGVKATTEEILAPVTPAEAVTVAELTGTLEAEKVVPALTPEQLEAETVAVEARVRQEAEQVDTINVFKDAEGQTFTEDQVEPVGDGTFRVIETKEPVTFDAEASGTAVVRPTPSPKVQVPPKKPPVQEPVTKIPEKPAEQATTETTPKTVEEVKATLDTDFTAIPPQTFSLRKEAIERERERLGLDGPESANKESFRQWQKEAQEAKIPENATKIANEIIKEPRALSPKEIAGLGIRLAEVTIDLEKSEEAMSKLTEDVDIAAKATDINRLEADRDLLIEAAPEIQKAAGRGLVALKMTIDRSFNLTAVLSRARAALRTKLSSAQKAIFTRLTKENEALSKRVEQLRKQVSISRANAYIKTRVSARQLSAMTTAQKDVNLNTLTAKLKALSAKGCDN